MKRMLILFAAAVLSSAAIFADTPPAENKPPATPAPGGVWGDSMLVAVAPPPFSSEDIFPCSRCHKNLETNPNRREMKWEHEKIALKHDEENRWCLDCHDAKNRDKLHLASGKLLDFTESFKLCGQCHGPTLRNWKAGEHGKRTGKWAGKKQYLLCPTCHDPHSPRFKPLKPLPPPVAPADLRKEEPVR